MFFQVQLRFGGKTYGMASVVAGSRKPNQRAKKSAMAGTTMAERANPQSIHKGQQDQVKGQDRADIAPQKEEQCNNHHHEEHPKAQQQSHTEDKIHPETQTQTKPDVADDLKDEEAVTPYADPAQTRQELIWDAEDFLRAFVATRWEAYAHSIRITCALTLSELRMLGHLDRVPGSRECRRLVQVPVLNDEIGLALWERLAADARGAAVHEELRAAEERRQREQVAAFRRYDEAVRVAAAAAAAAAATEIVLDTAPSAEKDGYGNDDDGKTEKSCCCRCAHCGASASTSANESADQPQSQPEPEPETQTSHRPFPKKTLSRQISDLLTHRRQQKQQRPQTSSSSTSTTSTASTLVNTNSNTDTLTTTTTNATTPTTTTVPSRPSAETTITSTTSTTTSTHRHRRRLRFRLPARLLQIRSLSAGAVLQRRGGDTKDDRNESESESESESENAGEAAPRRRSFAGVMGRMTSRESAASKAGRKTTKRYANGGADA